MSRVPISSTSRVLVLGGGVSGLSTAFALMRKGISVRVLEREQRPGGLIASTRENGFLLEQAATCLFNYRPEVDLFHQDLGLSGQQIFRCEEAKRRYLVAGGRACPIPTTPLSFLRSPLFKPWGKMRLLLEPLVPRTPSPTEHETVAQFITRRFGKEVYQRAVEPYISGTLAGDGERACLRSVFGQLAAMEEEHGSILKGVIARRMQGRRSTCSARVFAFPEGMAQLPLTMAAHLGHHFESGCQVEGVERKSTFWEVTVRKEDGLHQYGAEAIVLALPAGEAGRLLAPLSPSAGLGLRGIPYTPMVVAHMGFRRQDITHPLDGIGCLVPRVEKGFSLSGTLWPSTLFDQRAPADSVLTTNYLGGARYPEAIHLSDQEVTTALLADLDRLLGVRGAPTLVRIHRHARALPQYNLGHSLLRTSLADALKQLPGLFVTGNFLSGVSVRNCILEGMEAANRVETMLAADTCTRLRPVRLRAS